MDKQLQLEQITADIQRKNVCPDLAKSAHNLVMGDGSLDAEIMLIGEAPGKNEDLTGLPFVGASGKFLDAMLASIQLQRKDVYITNIVKYRPPNNRDPRADEKAAFWPYLLRQIEIIQPKVIITLGRHSMVNFLPGVKIGDVHGQLQCVHIKELDLAVVPLFHPAAALYNGSLRQTLMDDFLKIPELIKQLD